MNSITDQADQFSKPAILVFAIAIGLQFFMALFFEINWDEFFRLGWIYKFKSGELTHVLETTYIHGFRWLEFVSQNEVTQIVAARMVMFSCLCVSAFGIFKISERFTNARAALIAVIAFLLFSYVLRHGTAFRVDPPVIALLITAACLLTREQIKTLTLIIAGVLIGLAGAISMKSAFYLPTISLLLLVYWQRSGWTTAAFLKCLLCGGVAMLVWATVLALHIRSFDQTDSMLGFIGYASNSSLSEYGLFPRGGAIKQSAIQNPLFLYLLLFGFGLTIRGVRDKATRWVSIAIAGFALPLISIAVYAHSYAYFYVFLTAPLCLFIAVSVEKLEPHLPKIYTYAPLAFLVLATPHIHKSLTQSHTYQKQVNRVVHDIFPEPVAYIDRCSQISSFPKSGLFMTVMQMDEYYVNPQNVLRDDIIRDQPKFVVANTESLNPERDLSQKVSRQLKKPDQAALSDNYIHHWGPVYVAGKTLMSGSEETDFEIIIEGPYTVEATIPVMINGEVFEPYQVVTLARGRHTLSTRERAEVTLRWGDQLPVPNETPIGEKLFRGF